MVRPRGGRRFWGAVAALAALYLIAHLPFLPQSLEDLDSINFALGLRHFDPALHQPHPPGYPVYIALGRLSLMVLGRVAPSLSALRVEAVALAVWSLLGGALAIVATALFYRALEEVDPVGQQPERWSALMAAALLAAAPLFSISGVRPLSDMSGLAVALLAQALLLRGRHRPGALVMGAAVAGLAVGIRAQTVLLTGPLLVWVVAVQRGPGSTRRRVIAAAAAAAVCLCWAVPLLVLSGGWSSYVRALTSQAGDDFAGVNMLWVHPSTRLAALALYRTLALPWGDPRLGVVVAALAALGALFMAVRRPRELGVLCLAFLPYGVFQLLLQETATIRYALPLLVPVVWLALSTMRAVGRVGGLLWAAAAVSAVIVSVPTAFDYGEQAHPAFRAIADMTAEGEGAPPAALYSHFALYRAVQAAAPAWLMPVPPELHREWLGPVRFFRDGGAQTVWFLGDPLRLDMALFDPASVETAEEDPWRAYSHPEMGGARPVGARWYRIAQPGWMVGEGWSLTPEAGGRVRANGTGPERRPIEAFVRRRREPATALIGGFHLGAPGGPATELTISIDGRVVDAWTLGPDSAGRPFLRMVPLPAGTLEGSGPYATLTVAARSLDPGRATPEIAIRQFDLQSDQARPLLGFGAGWYEDEYEPETGLRWRWTSKRAELRLKAPGPIVLHIRGESPVKYVGSAPTVHVSAGSRNLATFAPAADFDWTVIVPLEALGESGGVVTIGTDRIYLPGPAEGTSDTRQLGLRVFECRADLQQKQR